MLDLLKLETFRVVANTRSFTRAAAELGYAQSSVTSHIQALEREVGAQLFERSRFSREIALTELGWRTLHYAGRLLALAHETGMALQSSPEPSGQIKVCTTPSLLAYRVSGLLGQYRIRYPEVRLGVCSYSDPRTLASSVLNGSADVAFVIDEPIRSDRVLTECLSRDEILIVCSPQHPLATQAGQVSLESLARAQAIFADLNCSVRLLFERALGSVGARLENTIEAGSLEAVKQCAIAGIGFGVVPSFSVSTEIRESQLVSLPVQAPELVLGVQIVRNARGWTSPAVRALWEMALPQPVVSSASA